MDAKQAWKALTFEHHEPRVGVDCNGHWTVGVAAEVGGDKFLRGITGRHSESVEAAILEAWNIIENLPSDRHLCLRSNRRVRWTGFMFEDVEIQGGGDAE